MLIVHMQFPCQYEHILDAIPDYIVSKYASLPARFRSQENEWTVLAGFVAVYSPQYYNISCKFVEGPHTKPSAPFPTVELISLGTGSRCLGQSLLSRWGEVTADMHAEILAHRVLTRMLFDDMKQLHLFCRKVQQNPRDYLPNDGNIPNSGADVCGDSPTAIGRENTILIVSKFFEMNLPLPSCFSMTTSGEHSLASAHSSRPHTTPSDTSPDCARAFRSSPTLPSHSSSSICSSLLRARPRAGLSWHLYISDPPCGVAAADVAAHVQFARHVEESYGNGGEYSGEDGVSGYSRAIMEEDIWEWIRKEGNSRDLSELLTFPACTCEETTTSQTYISSSSAPFEASSGSVSASTLMSTPYCVGAVSTAAKPVDPSINPNDVPPARVCPGNTPLATDSVVTATTHVRPPVSACARSRSIMAAKSQTHHSPSSPVRSPPSSTSILASDTTSAIPSSLAVIPSTSVSTPISPVGSSTAPIINPAAPGAMPALPTASSAPTELAVSAPSVSFGLAARGRTTGAKSLAWALQAGMGAGTRAGAEVWPGARVVTGMSTGDRSGEEVVATSSTACKSGLGDTCSSNTAATSSTATGTHAPCTMSDARVDNNLETRSFTSNHPAGCTGACVTGLRVKAGRSDLPPALRSLSLSCSDKVARWTRVGLQTALLAHFLDAPIPLATITIGATAAHANPLSLYRAIIGRNLPGSIEFPDHREVSNGTESFQGNISAPRHLGVAAVGIRGCVLRYRPPSLDTTPDATPNAPISSVPPPPSSSTLSSTSSSHANAASLSHDDSSVRHSRAGQWLISCDARTSRYADNPGSSSLPTYSSSSYSPFPSSVSPASPTSPSWRLPAPLLIVSGHTFPWAKHVQLARANNLPLHTTRTACITPTADTAAIVQPPSSGFSTCWSRSAVLPMAVTTEPAKNKKHSGSVASKPTGTPTTSSLLSLTSAASSHASCSSSSSSSVAPSLPPPMVLPCVWAADISGWADVLVGKVGLRQGSKRRPRDCWDDDVDVEGNAKKSADIGKRLCEVDSRQEVEDETSAVGNAISCDRDTTTNTGMNPCAGAGDTIAAPRQGKRSHDRQGDPDTDKELDVMRAVKRACPQQAPCEEAKHAVFNAHMCRCQQAPASGCPGASSSGSTPSRVSFPGNSSENPRPVAFSVLCRGRGWYGSVLQQLLHEFRTVISTEVTAALSHTHTSSDAPQPLGGPDAKARDNKNKKDAKQHRNPLRSALLPAWLVDGAGAPSISRLRMARVYADVLMHACTAQTMHTNAGACFLEVDANASALHTHAGASPACRCTTVICPLRVQSAYAKSKSLAQRSVTAPYPHNLSHSAHPPHNAAAGTPATPAEVDSASTSVTASLCALRVVTLAEAKRAGWHATWARQEMPRYTSYKKHSLQDMPVLLAEDTLEVTDEQCVDMGGGTWVVEMKSEMEVAQLFKLYGNPKP